MSANRSFSRRQFANGGQPSEFMQRAAKAVQEALPQDHGFCLLAFPLDSRDGGLRYVSNGSRESVLKLLKDFVAKQEALDFMGAFAKFVLDGDEAALNKAVKEMSGVYPDDKIKEFREAAMQDRATALKRAKFIQEHLPKDPPKLEGN